jgi:hypothetical protein
MSKVKSVIQKPITGVFKEDVQVGDKVMVVTTGRSRVSVRQGVYLGYTEGTKWGRAVQKAVIEIHTKRNVWFKSDGKEFDWRKDYNAATYDQIKGTLEQREVPYVHRTTLKLNRIATIK